jgi:hypothetical protein
MEALMTQREPSAAQALFPHLPHDAGQPVQRQQPASVAAAMFPNLTPPPPKPPTYWEIVARNVREAWAAANERAWGSGRDQTNK